jgi:hypothetical protein
MYAAVVISAAATGGAGQVLQVVFSSVGLFIGLVVALVVGIILFRARHRPGSRMRAVIDAGALAIPGAVGLVAGLVGMVVGIAYFVILFLYWLIYVIVASIWVSIVGGAVTYPAEFGQIAGQGFIYVGVGLLVAAAGALWLALVIVRAVRIARQRLTAVTYTNEPPPPNLSSPVLLLPPPEPLAPVPDPPAPLRQRPKPTTSKRLPGEPTRRRRKPDIGS